MRRCPALQPRSNQAEAPMHTRDSKHMGLHKRLFLETMKLALCANLQPSHGESPPNFALASHGCDGYADTYDYGMHDH